MLVLAAAAAGSTAPPAFAHAAFLGSTPEPGTRLVQSPRQITLRFTEPLNQRLSRVTLTDATTKQRIAASTDAPASRRLDLTPNTPLGRAPYRVDWHTVSTLDGHALEGSFGFGVQTASVGAEHDVQLGPLARGGWLRVVVRALLYAALLLFTGALLLSLLMRRAGSWLVPDGMREAVGGAVGLAQLRARERAVVIDAGLIAAGLAALAASVEAADAAGGFSVTALRDFLLTNAAGWARVAVVAFTLVGVWFATFRRPTLAASPAALALGAISVSGHANSASPRWSAVLTDWVHLLAASVWLGGISLIVLVWGPTLRGGAEVRQAVMGQVLPTFGSVALPAFLAVAVTGSVNAIIELGHPSALWQTDYGRVLAVKVTLVGLIALASWAHALRLRPRRLAANPHPSARLERRHWRLLRAEPVLGLGVVASVGLLVAFPLPPRQLDEGGPAAVPTCDPCPLPLPGANELPVADGAGSNLVAAWIRREEGELNGEVRVIDIRGRRSSAPVIINGTRRPSCGSGCWRFSAIPVAEHRLRVSLSERGRTYTASLPTRWHHGDSALARRLLNGAQATMRRLRSAREIETVTSGPGSHARVIYRLKAPNRMRYTTNGGARAITVGKSQWLRDTTTNLGWRRESYGGGLPFRTRDWFRWTPYARAVRLLSVSRKGGHRLAEVAVMDPGTPVWIRLVIDRSTMHVTRVRMIAEGHFMTQRLDAFNQPVRIVAPPR